MNNQYGLKKVLDSKDAVNALALNLDSSHEKIKTHVLELLAAVCLVPPNGHRYTPICINILINREYEAWHLKQ